MSDISKIQVGETLYDIKDVTARNNFTNTKTTTINDSSDDDHLPTAKTVYDYFNNQKTTTVDNGTNYNKFPTSGAVYNFINNKITSSISSSSTDSQIPTARAVYDYIQNNGGGSSGETSSSSTVKIDPGEYYTIQTMHLDASNLNEDQMFDGMYKLSNYTEHDGVYKFTDLNSGKVEYSCAYSMGGLLSAQLGENNLEVYIISNDCGLAYILLQDTHLTIPDEEGTSEMTLPAGFYLAVETEDYKCTVQHLKRQDNYIVQKRQSIQFDENALMGAFHKVSDNIDYSGLYSAQTIGMDPNGNELIPLYDCGGYFEPIENVYPKFTGFPAYALTSSSSIHVQGVPAAAIFTQSFTVPAGAAGNAEDMFISAGTYMSAFKMPFDAILELVKLQEKEEILDIDALFGSTLEYGSFTETLNSQIFSTGSASLNLNQEDFNGNIISTETIYNMFKSAFEQGGSVKLKLHGTIGNAYTNMLCPTTLWKSNNTIGAAATLTLYNNNDNVWITYKLQIYSYKNYFSLYCEGSLSE